MPHLNQLQASWQSQGFEVVGVNYANSDSEIASFISTYAVGYGVASVTDDSGYTVPIYSTCFAISRWGTVLWTGRNDTVTDTMVQGWLAAVPPSNASDEDSTDDGCVVAESSGPWPAMLTALMLIAAVVRVGAVATKKCVNEAGLPPTGFQIVPSARAVASEQLSHGLIGDTAR